ncbi:MAG TPA: nucleotidyltransferase family protein [Candidatus Sulfotelmatobacter sp.]|nr:nucleotidyltransferase family protein [Candidatus Sulfotelmatobacter sp.]
MKAMVLAAGLGTRLRPLTDHQPKALVEVGGRTLLEITLGRLKAAGICEVILNVHHFAANIREFLDAHNNFGMNIAISPEEQLLDTGGGLKKAGWFFLEDNGDEPFVLHNVDVISTVDFAAMAKQHRESGALATLAVQDRETSRYLLFDENWELCGRRSLKEKQEQLVRPVEGAKARAFGGIHVISPRMLKKITEDGVFSIIDVYLRLAGQRERVQAFCADEYYWRDLGKLDQVEAAERDWRDRRFA